MIAKSVTTRAKMRDSLFDSLMLRRFENNAEGGAEVGFGWLKLRLSVGCESGVISL